MGCLVLRAAFALAFWLPLDCVVRWWYTPGRPLGPLLFAAALQPLANDLRIRGGLDLAVFYLDDGVLAGEVGAVGLALFTSSAAAASTFGSARLFVCMGDAAAGDLSPHLPRELLWDCASQPRLQRNFDLLGAAIGDSAFVASHTRSRVESAEPLLAALAEVEDAQVGLMLLRSCAGHVRLVHSMRCTPSPPQLVALAAFNEKVRACFASLTGLHLTPQQWEQAGRGGCGRQRATPFVLTLPLWGAALLITKRLTLTMMAVGALPLTPGSAKPWQPSTNTSRSPSQLNGRFR